MLSDAYQSAQPPYLTRQHVTITNALRLLWVIVVISGELGAFFWSLSGCTWPELDLGKSRNQNSAPPSHVLLVADPQIHQSALLSKDSAWANPIRRVLFELNLRKNWRVTLRLQPDVIIFLGDMLANGKSARNPLDYQQASQKFKSIFTTTEGIKVYYIPGNNDVGLGATSQLGHSVRSYYQEAFGPFNQQFRIANHTFVALDAPGIVEEDYARHGKSVDFDHWKPTPNGPVQFVKEVAKENPRGNVILLSHIPLSRSETASCGPLRERGSIQRGAGPGYQSMLGKQTTTFLLQNLQPSLIFSADNRDYCDYTHILPGIGKALEATHAAKIREVTVKSFAMSVHIRRPGFQLLSLVDPESMPSSNMALKDSLCLLPDQYRIYTSFYGPCLVVTAIIIFLVNFHTRVRLFGTNSRAKQQRPGLRNGLALSLTPSPRSSGRSSPMPYADGKLNPWSAASSTGWMSPQPSSPRFGLPPHLRAPLTPSASRSPTPVPASPASVVGSFNGYEDRYVNLEEEDDDDDTMYPSQYVTMKRRDEESWPHVSSPRRLPNHYLHSHRRSQDEVDEGLQLPGFVYNSDAGFSSTRSSISLSQPPTAEFISAPPSVAQQTPTTAEKATTSSRPQSRRYSPIYTRTFTFTLLNRRRRIHLQFPPAFLLPSSYSMSSLHNLLDLCGIHIGSNASQEPVTLLDTMNLRRRRRGGSISALIDFCEVFWPAIIVWIIINWTIL